MQHSDTDTVQRLTLLTGCCSSESDGVQCCKSVHTATAAIPAAACHYDHLHVLCERRQRSLQSHCARGLKSVPDAAAARPGLVRAQIGTPAADPRKSLFNNQGFPKEFSR
jgi:hypothetical protein